MKEETKHLLAAVGWTIAAFGVLAFWVMVSIILAHFIIKFW